MRSSIALLVLMLGLSVYFCQSARSQTIEAKAESHAEDGFCYSPSLANISYSQVLESPIDASDKTLFYGQDPLQFGELWLPKTQRPAPVVVLIHGGCWLNSFDLNHVRGLATALARSGYAVWALEYRRTGDDGGGWPGTYQDIALAMSQLRLLEPFAVDIKKIALVGHSAGGHLAMLYGSQHQDAAALLAVIGLAPIIDLVAYANGTNSCEIATPKFMQGSPKEVPDAYMKASLVEKSLHPNTFIIHGRLDEIVDVSQTKAAPEARVNVVEGAGHFDMIHPNTQSFSTLLRVLAKTL